MLLLLLLLLTVESKPQQSIRLVIWYTLDATTNTNTTHYSSRHTLFELFYLQARSFKFPETYFRNTCTKLYGMVTMSRQPKCNDDHNVVVEVMMKNI